MNDFDFIFSTEETPEMDSVKPEYTGPNLSQVVKMTPKKFATSVLEVYEQLGGASWLLLEAKANPRGFLELLKKMIPSGIQMDDLHGFSIRLIDQFGNEVIMEKSPGGVPAIAPPLAASDAARPGQPETATGGNPNNAVGVVSDVKIKETYD